MFNINEVIAQYEMVFEKINEKYFNGELPKPVISIQAGKGDAYGWCTNYAAWVNNDEQYFEINICAEYLNRSIEEICSTIFHEMVHLKNVVNGIKDCNGKYHGAKFKVAAEEIGLSVEKTTYGYSKTILNDEHREFINALNLKDFGFKRISPSKKLSINKGKKYQCPVCGASFWSSKTLNVHCEDCDEDFEIVNQ